MKITIVGTGAMGSVYAGLLGSAGHEVTALDTWTDHVDAIAASGLRVTGASGDRQVSLAAGTVAADAGPSDLWIIGTKADAVPEVAAAIAPLLRPDDIVMAFQNGLGAGERVAAHLPAEHVMIGIAEGFASSIPEPGHVHHEGMRLIRVGEMTGGRSARLGIVEDAFGAAGFNVAAFEDIDRMIWEKFICNVTLSAPCAAFDLTIGQLAANPHAWPIATACATEAYRIGVASGVTFSFDDPVHYVTEFAATIPDGSPSMRLDHLAGRRSEIDVINGAAVDRGRELGIPTPYNDAMCAVVRVRESTFG